MEKGAGGGGCWKCTLSVSLAFGYCESCKVEVKLTLPFARQV